MAPPILRVLRLGVTPYLTALDLQSLAAARRAGRSATAASSSPSVFPLASANSPRIPPSPDLLLALQHPPVVTIGKRQAIGASHIIAGEDELAARGVEVHRTARGGDVTFHGPGQAVLYPVLRLPDLRLGARRYVEGLEDVMVRGAARFGVEARGRVPGMTGVWVGWDEEGSDGDSAGVDASGGISGGDSNITSEGGSGRKIGAVGVQISGGVTRHGLAFNISTDLSFFKLIVPCGLEGKAVTSLNEERRRLAGKVRRIGGVEEGGNGRSVGTGATVSCDAVTDASVDVDVETVTDVLIEEFVREFGFEEERCSDEQQWLR
ncbi:unnamed protein product [Closterium sp. NIES-53]